METVALINLKTSALEETAVAEVESLLPHMGFLAAA